MANRMCGISGIISNYQIPTTTLEQMTDIIAHRGPDGFGYFSDIGIALGHRRLAIVDLTESGHQPMTYLDKYVITYNGEIYNYIELRQELADAGYRFQSETDTEVIMAAYDKWGVDCVHRLNGMWAFVIYDKTTRSVFCSRDRFGVKPFYYWVGPDQTIYFASEIKQFTVIPGWRAQVNSQRAYDYLVFSLTHHTDETLFRNVFEIKGGSSIYLTLADIQIQNDGRLPIKRWYQLTPATFTGDFEASATEFRRLFMDSVRLRLRADVPVGSCLSGGLDSSSIVCSANILLKASEEPYSQMTFSAYNEQEQFSEKKWVDTVLDTTNVDGHHVYPLFSEMFDSLSQMTWHQDEPVSGAGVYSQWCVFRLGAQHKIKVMLDGQGADELLAGYSSFFAPRLKGLLKSGRLLTLVAELRLIKQNHGVSYLDSLIRVIDLLLPKSIRKLLHLQAGSQDYAPEWLNQEILQASPDSPYHNLGDKIDSVKAMSRRQFETTHLPTLLHWEDRNSMAHSIESRCPFLDYRLVEFAMGLPDSYKLADGITKRVLRRGMNGILPNIIRDRVSKLGFMAPEEMWMKTINPDIFREKMKAAIEASDGILNASALQVLEDTITGNREFTALPWRLINFGLWMKTFNVSAT